MARRVGARRLAVWRRHRGLLGDDVFLASYPKSGNTWVKFVLADLASGGDVDYAESERLVPTVGGQASAPPLLPDGGRILKTHEPYRPVYRRSVYLIRDPRDVALSYLRWLRRSGVAHADVAGFLERFMAGAVGGYGAWSDHVGGWVERARHDEGVLVLWYEDLLVEPVSELTRAAVHVGVPADSARVRLAVERNTAERMREKEAANSEFFRSIGRTNPEVSFVGGATAGAWRDALAERELQILRPAADVYEWSRSLLASDR